MAKAFAWSFSKLKNYETCPKRYNEIDVLKTYSEPVEPGGPLDWGNRVHAAMAKALRGEEPLPAEMADFQIWVNRVLAGPGKLLVEQKYAINRSFGKTSWFGHDAWYRGIGDVVRIADDIALVLDWKTGKVVPNSVQLGLMAQCIFSHFPQVKLVRSEFIWLQDEDTTTPEIFDREKLNAMWVDLIGRVDKLQKAHIEQSFPPTPSYLCKRHCAVVSCPYHGK